MWIHRKLAVLHGASPPDPACVQAGLHGASPPDPACVAKGGPWQSGPVTKGRSIRTGWETKGSHPTLGAICQQPPAVVYVAFNWQTIRPPGCSRARVGSETWQLARLEVSLGTDYMRIDRLLDFHVHPTACALAGRKQASKQAKPSK